MVQQFFKPLYEQYSTEASRLSSYETWSKGMGQKPAEMSDAGFFYTGLSDKVICYFCGGGVKDWSPDDIPWEEHARFFQKCPYVLTIKGEEYIHEIVSGKIKPPYKIKSKEQCEELQPIENVFDEKLEQKIKHHNLICKICLEDDLDTCFIPCGHAVACGKCSLSLNNNTCPICRKVYYMSIKIYF